MCGRYNNTANLPAEASDDMKHISNGDTWREVWRHLGVKRSLIAKVEGHTGILSNEIVDVFAFVGSKLQAGECRKCTLSEEDVHRLASRDPNWNSKNKHIRRERAKALAAETQPPLHFCPAPNPPRKADDFTPLEKEIWFELVEMNCESAPGPDGIRPRDLKDPRLFPIVVRIIQEVWRSGKIPRHWLKSYLIGIPKQNDTITRGIALTPSLLKVLTAIIRRRAAGSSLLSSQWGFRSHRGTAQATVLLREMTNRRAAAGLRTTTIAVDLQKAFDSVRRDGIDRLLREYGYGPNASRLVEQIYDGDTMYLFLGNENKTDAIRPEKGVKQGCLLSPSTFNLFIDREGDGKRGKRLPKPHWP